MDCALPPELCLCAHLKPLALSTRVIAFLHRREVYKTTNTASLIPLTLLNSAVHVVGLPEDRIYYAGLEAAGRRTLLLYPGEKSIPLTAGLADGSPVTLVVPDGNWRQARRMALNEPELARLQAVHLPDGPPRRFELRKHPDEARFSTLEAVARALGIIEGPGVQAELERILALKVERVLRTRGQLNQADDGE